jgi:hypothetical protein
LIRHETDYNLHDKIFDPAKTKNFFAVSFIHANLWLLISEPGKQAFNQSLETTNA